MDRVADFFAQRTVRRFVALVVFLATLYLFRHLAVLLVFFVTFERAFRFLSGLLAKHSNLTRKKSVLAVIAMLVLGFAGLVWLGVGKTLRAYTAMHASFPDRLAELKDHPLLMRLEEEVGGTAKMVEHVKHYSGDALVAVSTISEFVVHIVMGFVLALVYVIELDEIDEFWEHVDRRSLAGTLARWFGYVADATTVTVQLQLIVAGCNTLMTLPVLLLLGVPNIGPLMLLIFVSALVPVIGNVVSGVVLSLLAYKVHGWGGVGVIIGLTFVLHKIEAYYLNPRLTSRHVKMPGFLLIVSLLACEHLFGFKGLFLSFPILFVAGHIRSDFANDDTGPAASPLTLNDDLDQLPGARSIAPPSTPAKGPLELEPSRRTASMPPAVDPVPEVGE